MKITTIFKNSTEAPIIGLTPKITITDITDINVPTAVVTFENMTDVDNGFYAYNFDLFEDKKDYTVMIDADSVISGRYQYGTIDKFTLEADIEGDLGIRELLKLFTAVLANRSNGGGTNTISFRDYINSKNRIVASVDENGNRLNVTLDTD